MTQRFVAWSLVGALGVTACFNPEEEDGGATDPVASTGSSSTSSTGGSEGAESSTTTEGATESSSGAQGSESTAADEGTGSTTSGGEEAPTFCSGAAMGLSACAVADPMLAAYGTVACDVTDTDFSQFYEDVYTVVLAAGDCLTVRVDNVAAAGPTGQAQGDIAFQVRSPSGLYTFADDEVACSDPTWTGGGQCPLAYLTADVSGAYEIAVTQASGGGCINPAPYAAYVAINGVDLMLPAPDVDDAHVDCDG